LGKLGKKRAIIGQKIKREIIMPEILSVKASDLVLKVIGEYKSGKI